MIGEIVNRWHVTIIRFPPISAVIELLRPPGGNAMLLPDAH